MSTIGAVYILPTGDEIKGGIVLDLDSPEIMAQTVKAYPEALVTRLTPIVDVEDAIINKISELTAMEPDLIVLIGGSGGGHRFSNTLGKDYTHSALTHFLNEYSSHEIYGKNGHLWSKLICGRRDKTMLINVPGPMVEAAAAYRAFLQAYEAGLSVNEISKAMADAVYAQYPAGKAQQVQTEQEQ